MSSPFARSQLTTMLYQELISPDSKEWYRDNIVTNGISNCVYIKDGSPGAQTTDTYMSRRATPVIWVRGMHILLLVYIWLLVSSNIYLSEHWKWLQAIDMLLHILWDCWYAYACKHKIGSTESKWPKIREAERHSQFSKRTTGLCSKSLIRDYK